MSIRVCIHKMSLLSIQTIHGIWQKDIEFFESRYEKKNAIEQGIPAVSGFHVCGSG